MAPLPGSFGVPAGSNIDSVERLAAHALVQVLAAGDNRLETVNETGTRNQRRAQLYTQFLDSAVFQGWVLILRLSTNLNNNYLAGTDRIWTQISPVGATTAITTGFNFPSTLGLTNWERVFHWAAAALQATVPNFLAPERGTTNLRAATTSAFPVEWSADKSWLLISRLSLPLGPTWQTTGIVPNVQTLTADQIPTAFRQ
jgi:hypothetical protein